MAEDDLVRPAWLKRALALSLADLTALTTWDELPSFWERPSNPTPLDRFVGELVESVKKPHFPTRHELDLRDIHCPYASARYALYVATATANRDANRPRAAKASAVLKLRGLADGILADTKRLARGLEELDFHVEPIGANVDVVEHARVADQKAAHLRSLNATALDFFGSLRGIVAHLDRLEADLQSQPSKPEDIWRMAFAFEMRRWWVLVFGAAPPTTGGNSTRPNDTNRANRFTQMLAAAFATLDLGETTPWADLGRKSAEFDERLKDRPWLSSGSPASGIAFPPVPVILLHDLRHRLDLMGNPDPQIRDGLTQIIDEVSVKAAACIDGPARASVPSVPCGFDTWVLIQAASRLLTDRGGSDRIH